jgi:hypothetical protein
MEDKLMSLLLGIGVTAVVTILVSAAAIIASRAYHLLTL